MSSLIYTSTGNQKIMNAHFNQIMSLSRLLKLVLPWKHKILMLSDGLIFLTILKNVFHGQLKKIIRIKNKQAENQRHLSVPFR